jgi:hypothetical protein
VLACTAALSAIAVSRCCQIKNDAWLVTNYNKTRLVLVPACKACATGIRHPSASRSRCRVALSDMVHPQFIAARGNP